MNLELYNLTARSVTKMYIPFLRPTVDAVNHLIKELIEILTIQ